MRIFKTHIAGVVVVLLVSTLCGRVAAQEAKTALVEKRLVCLGPWLEDRGTCGAEPTFSPDYRRLAYPLRVADKWRIVCDGRSGPAYKRVSQRPVFSRDGRHVAYVAWDGKTFVVVRDGRAGRAYDDIPMIDYERRLVFSADGRRLAYAARRGKSWFVVVNDIESRPWDDVNNPCVSRDSKHLAYAAQVKEKWFAVRDGEKGPAYDEVQWPWFTPDGKHFVYVARRGEFWVLVVDGKELPAHDGVEECTFSPDGGRLAYAFRRGKKFAMVVDGAESPAYDNLESPTFSPDGKRLAYQANYGAKPVTGRKYVLDGSLRGGKNFMVIDGKPGPRYDQVSYRTVFSRDGRHLAYCAKRGDKWCVVHNGETLREYTVVGRPVFSPDGRHLAYIAVRGARMGEDGYPVDGEWCIVCDGREGETYRLGIDAPVFSPDSKHLAYRAVRWGGDAEEPEQRHLVVCDGVEGPMHDELWTPWYRWRSDEVRPLIEGRLRYAVAGEDAFCMLGGLHLVPGAWLVEVDWPADRDWSHGLKPPGSRHKE